MQYEESFAAWLDESLPETTPANVKAYCFNLIEIEPTEEAGFGVELVGSSKFDSEDDDWPCHECWEPEVRAVLIPFEYSGRTWQECLEAMRTLIRKILASESSISRRLRATSGLGLGFVDGDLEVIEAEP